MWRRHKTILKSQNALSDLVGLLRTFATRDLVVSAEVAQNASVRSSRMFQLPQDLQSAIESAVADFDVSNKDVKLKSQELTARLKHLSRTKHRGGVHPNLRETCQQVNNSRSSHRQQQQPRGKHRQAEHRCLIDLTRTAAMPVLDQDLSQLDTFLDTTEQTIPAPLRHSIHQKELYNQATAAAYAASRMPACFTALHRALSEVSKARPGWRPESVLDYGSGPGTAAWVVRDIWRENGQHSKSAIDVQAIEPVPYMAALAQEVLQQLESQEKETLAQITEYQLQNTTATAESIIEKAIEANSNNEDDVPPPAVLNMRWSHKLYKQDQRGRGGLKRYDLVVAGYVLAEVRDEKERRRIVDELWQRTSPSGVLVIVEPGTPAGSARVLAARTQILSTLSSPSSHALHDDSSNSSSAHVLAPCPHDGKCPLENKQAWCHFVQRFERPPMARAVKKGPRGSGARTYQDERFAYVVLAKGPRQVRLSNTLAIQLRDSGSGVGHIDVAGNVPPSEDDEYAQEYLNIPTDLRPKRINLENAVLPEDYSYEEALLDPGHMKKKVKEDSNLESDASHEQDDLIDQLNQADLDELTRALIMKSLNDSDDDEDDEDSDNEEESLSPSSHSDTTLNNDDSLDPELIEQLNQAITETLASSAPSSRLSGSHANLTATTTTNNNNNYSATLPPVIGYGESGPEAISAAAASSTTWSRIIRMPRKRSGHIVLDVCSAVDATGQPDPSGDGVLLRQIVSKVGSKKSVGGVGAYRLAKRLMWGDVWPMGYQRRIKAIHPPGSLEGLIE